MDESTKRDMERYGYELILPGLTIAFERARDILNATRTALALPLICADYIAEPHVETRGRPRKQIEGQQPEAGSSIRRTISVEQKALIAKSAGERWALVKEAGIATRRMPSAEMVERAKKIIERRKSKIKS